MDLSIPYVPVRAATHIVGHESLMNFNIAAVSKSKPHCNGTCVSVCMCTVCVCAAGGGEDMTGCVIDHRQVITCPDP